MNNDWRRIKIGKPCAYASMNRSGKPTVSYPEIDCDGDCYRCGWNPTEMNRRLATGKFVEHNGIKTLYFKRNSCW